MATCQKGHKNPDGHAFCGECGAPLIQNGTANTGRSETDSGASGPPPKTLADKIVGEWTERRAEVKADQDPGPEAPPTPEVDAATDLAPAAEHLSLFPAVSRVARTRIKLNSVKGLALALGVLGLIAGVLALAGIFGGGSSGLSQAESKAEQRHRHEVSLAASALSSLKLSWAGFVGSRAAAINQEAVDSNSNNLAAARVDIGREGSAAGGLIAAIQAGIKAGSFPSSVEPDVSAWFSAVRSYQLAAQAARDDPNGLDFSARLASVAAARTILDEAHDGVVRHLRALATR